MVPLFTQPSTAMPDDFQDAIARAHAELPELHLSPDEIAALMTPSPAELRRLASGEIARRRRC